MLDQHKETDSTKKVMVIDDHVLFREGLISLFRSTPDFKVVGEAGTVHGGIEKAKLLKPDIILMDFSLPDGTGLDATKAILAAIPDCKIIFLTIYEADDKLFEAIRAGARGYLPKNVSTSDLIPSLLALERGEMAISRKMASSIAEEFAKSESQSIISEDVFSKLSPRELDVLWELQTGATNLEIAERLFITENTVKQHMRNIMKKLGVKNRREASLIAKQAGLKRKYTENPRKEKK